MTVECAHKLTCGCAPNLQRSVFKNVTAKDAWSTKLTRSRKPTTHTYTYTHTQLTTHLYRSVSRSRDDVLAVEVDNIDGCSVADENPPEVDVGGGLHVPHGDGSVLHTQFSLFTRTLPTEHRFVSVISERPAG